MDFKLTRQSVSVNEVIYDGSAEQPVELDYILPDYYPDIFKILKCRVSPKVISAKCSGSKLIIDAAVFIKVLYEAPESSTVEIIDQKYTFSKSVDLPKETAEPTVRVTAKSDYMNCRAVNERRIDIRGAVSCKINVEDSVYQDIARSAEGCGIQLKPAEKKCVVSRLGVSKYFTVREEIDLNEAESFASTIETCETLDMIQTKIIANKIIFKAKINSEVLYKKENGEISDMSFDIPVSQIIDLNGISEDDKCNFDSKIVMCELTPVKGANGETKTLSCEYLLFVECEACSEEEITVVTDAYSTKYEAECVASNIHFESAPEIIRGSFVKKAELSPSEEISSVVGSWSEIGDATAKIIDGRLSVFGNLCVSVLARNTDGRIVLCEKNEPFEYELSSDICGDASVVCVKAEAVKTKTFSGSDNKLEIEAGINTCVTVKAFEAAKVISDIKINTEAVKEKSDDYALKIYYAQSGEELWSIAKRYNTSITGIINENDGISDAFEERTMILIPIAE